MGKTVKDIIEDKYEVKTSIVENPVITAAGAAAAIVFRNNPNRIAMVLINLSANSVYLGFSNQVSATNGFYIDKSGGFVSFNCWDDFILPTHEMWIIAPAGASNIYSVELLIE